MADALTSAWASALSEPPPDRLAAAWASALAAPQAEARKAATPELTPAPVEPALPALPVMPAPPHYGWTASFSHNSDGVVTGVLVASDDLGKPMWVITPQRDAEGRAVAARIEPVTEIPNG